MLKVVGPTCRHIRHVVDLQSIVVDLIEELVLVIPIVQVKFDRIHTKFMLMNFKGIQYSNILLATNVR